MVSVRKKDGSVEEWSDDKLVTSIGKSGVDISIAENLSNNISSWAAGLDTDVVSSSDIRDKVIEELKKVDEVASETYRVYKK